uniref:Neur_chan_memb domain-containing protein n=1 Tax=Steinernema glaseri TaxID=37863 RepID=A0A1I7YKU0_9BILA
GERREKSSDPRGRFDEAGNDPADTMKLRRTSFLDFIFICLQGFLISSTALLRGSEVS